MFSRSPGITRAKKQQGRLISSPPNNACPATAIDNGGFNVTLDGYATTTSNPIQPTLYTKNNNFFWILHRSKGLELVQQQWVIGGLETGTMKAICDGSYKPKLCPHLITACWKIEGNIGETIEGLAATKGHSADAYRSELLGIYGLLNLILYIELHNSSYNKGFLKVGCDNDIAGWMSGQHKSRVSSSTRHLDLIKAIRYIQHQLKTQIEFYHLYGHQDESTNYTSLPRI